ncbi:CsbD family protein [Oscillatoria salina]|uniref:CsbD family protein n=1 Tax=Oscillatoria salina TaxID=331517 RepID=UPI001CCE4940|nr:CsbD family protein [Oscillatoria salina]
MIKKIFRFVLPICLICLLFVGVGVPSASANPNMSGSQALIALENTFEGIGDKIQGKTNEAAGKAQRNFGTTSNQVEGALREAKGKAQQAAGEAKINFDRTGDKIENSLDRAEDRAENTGENLVEKVKDFFD